MIEPLEVDITNNESQKIANNLKNLLNSHHMTVNQLAQELSIPMMTVRRLILGETKDPRVSTLKLIADYFKVSVDSLLEEQIPMFRRNLTHSSHHHIPIINWHLAEKIESIHELDLKNWNAWQAVPPGIENTLSENTFALESRPSMYPRFPHDTIFIIDPDASPIDGDFVLVKIKENNELTLRELTIDPPDWLLHSVVSDSKTLQYVKNLHKIVGVNILTMLYNRKKFS